MPPPLYDSNEWALSASQIALLLPATAILTASKSQLSFFSWCIQKKKKLLIRLYDNSYFHSVSVILLEDDNELFPSYAVIYFCLSATPRVPLLSSSHAWFSCLGTRTLVAHESQSQFSSDCRNNAEQLN